LARTLKEVGDLERLVSRASQGRSNARELVALRRSFEAIPAVQEALTACNALAVRSLAGEITDAPELAAELARALAEDPPAVARTGGTVRPGSTKTRRHHWLAHCEVNRRT
jgi:DNA mismatch repair protein MutS